MRLIDADPIVEHLEDEKYSKDEMREDFGGIEWMRGYNKGLKVAIRCIKNMKAVDPVKHGHWIIEDHYLGGGDIVRRLGRCSWCNNLCGEGKYAYCPHCGAKMDGVSE